MDVVKDSLVQKAGSVRLIKVVIWAKKEDGMQTSHEIGHGLDGSIFPEKRRMRHDEFVKTVYKVQRAEARCYTSSRSPRHREEEHSSFARVEDDSAHQARGSAKYNERKEHFPVVETVHEAQKPLEI